MVTGTQGCGVRTPPAADVAAATCGLDGERHIANGRMFTFALKSSTVAFNANVTGSEDAEAGVHQIPFEIFSFGGPNFNTQFGQLVYELTQPTGCFVRTKMVPAGIRRDSARAAATCSVTSLCF